MQRLRIALLGVPVLALAVISLRQIPIAQAGEKHSDPPLKLKIGDTAPDFELLAYDGKELKKVALHDYRGKKNVALAFYVFAFTGG